MKAGAYMSNQNYIMEILELKDKIFIFMKIIIIKRKLKALIVKSLKATYLINLLIAINVVLSLMIYLKNMVLLPLILKFLMSLVIKQSFVFINNVIFANIVTKLLL